MDTPVIGGQKIKGEISDAGAKGDPFIKYGDTNFVVFLTNFKEFFGREVTPDDRGKKVLVRIERILGGGKYAKGVIERAIE